MKRINKLYLKDYRLFGSTSQTITFSEDRNVTIIVGNNGSGKSSILDAISAVISAFTSNFPGQSIKQFSDYDVHITEEERMGDYLYVGAQFSTTYNGDIEIQRYRQGRTKSPEGVLRGVRSYAELLMGKINDNEPCNLPIVAYYGTGRGQIKAPERRRDFKKVFTRWDAYSGALEANANFKQFIQWFDLMEDSERRERETLRDWDFKNKSLETVRRALSLFVGDKFTNPRMELHPMRFVMDELLENGDKRQIRIEQMSDGYKIITAMVADIASRMAEANPEMEDPLLSNGIVLIDEIDLHLHPKWQRTIVGRLTETFPNIQFIVSTHSPIIISGALDNAEMIILSGEQVNEVSGSEYITYDISQLLLSDLFGLDSSRATRWTSTIEEQQRLLQKTNRTAEEDSRLDEINRELSVLSYGETLEQIQTRQLLNQIAHRLNIEGYE